MTRVRVILKNLEIHVDREMRQNSASFWKPLSSSWEMAIPVVVWVPEESQYVANIPEENLVGALYAKEPKVYNPALTPLGYAFVHRELEDALNELDPVNMADDEPWDTGLNLKELKFED